MFISALEEFLAGVHLRPKREPRLNPARLLLLDGTCVCGSVLAVSLFDGEIILEEFYERSGAGGIVAKVQLADPQCFENLLKTIRDFWDMSDLRYAKRLSDDRSAQKLLDGEWDSDSTNKV